MSGETLHYKRYLGLKIGQYCQVHEHEEPRNIQVSRTKGGIFLGPSGNKQGGFRFMSLNSAKNVTRRIWDTIPMPDTVITRVNEIAYNEPYQFIFADRRGLPIVDDAITVVDRDADDSNKNQAPQDPHCKLQAIEEIEEEPVITDRKIDLNINHETPTEQVQAPEEPPAYLVTVTGQPPMTETNITHQPRSGVRISSRVRTQNNSYPRSM